MLCKGKAEARHPKTKNGLLITDIEGVFQKVISWLRSYRRLGTEPQPEATVMVASPLEVL